MKRIGIACLNTNNAIGNSNKLLYNIPSELRFFKDTTLSTPSNKITNILLMGRKTFDSIKQRPLPNRMNYVISSQYKKLNDTYNHIPYLQFFPNINDAIDCSNDNIHLHHNMFVCGGEVIYKYCIENNLLDYLVLTKITAPILNSGDTFFPNYTSYFTKIDTKHFKNKEAIILDTNKSVKIDYSINTYSKNNINYRNSFSEPGTFEYYNKDYTLDLHYPESNSESKKKITTRYTPQRRYSKLYSNIDMLLMPHLKKLNYTTEINRLYSKDDNMEYNYLTNLEKVLKEGKIRKTRNSNTISHFGIDMSFDISKSIPLLTTKKIYWNGVLRELLWFLKGNTDAKILQEKKVHIWDGNSSREYLDSRGLQHLPEGDCGPVYGFQWRHFNANYIDCTNDYKDKGIDQLQTIIDTIKTDPMSRRMVMSAWNPCQLDEMCLPPCHILYQFYVTLDEFNQKHLSCSMYQRSGDMFLGIPFNIASTSALTYIIAHMTNCKPDKITIKIGDAHIYESHIDAVKTQLKRTPGIFPELKIVGKPKKCIEDYNESNFQLNNYNPQSIIKAVMAV